MEKTLEQLINEFHLATLITADQNLGFEKHEQNKRAFKNDLLEHFKIKDL